MIEYNDKLNKHLDIKYNAQCPNGEDLDFECETSKEAGIAFDKWFDNKCLADNCKTNRAEVGYIVEVGFDDDGEEYELSSTKHNLEYIWED